jgi:EAL domain-containing protein (putative c-di-GMP-specific phosphodiesterase class I)
MHWDHPRHGLLEESEFLRLAEDTGAMTGLRAWLLKQACRDAQAWQRTSPGMAVQVGLSARQLDQPALSENILLALTASGLAPHLLRLELGEEVLSADKASLAPGLERIAELGVRFTPSHQLARAIDSLGQALGMSVVVEPTLERIAVGRAA